MDNLISHHLEADSLKDTYNKIKNQIEAEGDNIYISQARQLEILNELYTSNLGRFLLCNQGLNGYWTHYILTYPFRLKKMWGCFESYNNLNNTEKFILEKAPGVLASQQRFQIFLKENQRAVYDGALIASIPCGTMAELIYLDFSKVKQIKLLGIDLDDESLIYAKQLAERNSLEKSITTLQKNAWHLDLVNELDLISSSGLNIYEPDEDKKIALYDQFYKALRVGGTLVTSFLTYPSTYKSLSEWQKQHINLYDLIMQKVVFADIINAKWENFDTSEQIISQLKSVGFKNIRIIYDKAKMFPTVISEKIK